MKKGRRVKGGRKLHVLRDTEGIEKGKKERKKKGRNGE